MSIVSRIRALDGVGILQDLKPKDAGVRFRRRTLISGLNGAGKTTLSRVLASLQHGERQAALPEGCKFEIEMYDGGSFGLPKASKGLENRVCVFNSDFVNRNLRWDEGHATSVFYISEAQADAAKRLKECESELPLIESRCEQAEVALKLNEKVFAAYKRDRAKTVAGHLYADNRKYEANHLSDDYAAFVSDEDALITDEDLSNLIDVTRRASPPPSLREIAFEPGRIREIVVKAVKAAAHTLGATVATDLEAHPSMMGWVRQGFDYHQHNGVDACLYCGQQVPDDRKQALAAVLNDSLRSFLDSLAAGRLDAQQFSEDLTHALMQRPPAESLIGSQQQAYGDACRAFIEASDQVIALMGRVGEVFVRRMGSPVAEALAHDLPDDVALSDLLDRIRIAINACDAAIRSHNDAVANFASQQSEARKRIRRHYVSEGRENFMGHRAARDAAEKERNELGRARQVLLDEIAKLQAAVRSHGPAASKITQLVRQYLGHAELTVVPAESGYELHRHGKLVLGPPSEGEKTAIALCYFISTLAADGRELKNLIVVIDDPISSLDTKALNYACALVRSLEGAAQLIVLTHNQPCANEFRKAWKKASEPRQDGKDPDAALLYLDVIVPAGTTVRRSTLVELPTLLRNYDSEYHYLFHQLLEHEALCSTYAPHAYLMPNVMRRVLETFMAFKVPGTSGLTEKLQVLAKRTGADDRVRLTALERLSHVESHSDSLDDLLNHSPMTLEEVNDANKALLEFIEAADEEHAKAMRRQCIFRSTG